MAWVWLLVASAAEVGWMVLLKESGGFSRLGPSLGFLAAVAVSMVGLALAVREIPIGTAYAVWTGLGAAAIAVVGILAYGEPRTALRLACIALILAGIAGLKLTSSA